ncbi:MAG: UDP-4-amino-4,6-dideoxy-N-acetyl-beta-L-altrosamine N-acetyltransferase [Elusimicrobia bacterium]|nr:UDP-4-amino-4,6-dideoxy-N-acetyl-beta-L-altrosamine N-acetyltransferase [Elusimicrobiota bacterium]
MTPVSSCSLRPLTEADLDLVRAWRNSDRVRSVMYTDHVISPEEHRRWFAGLKGDSNRLYLIFEVNGRPAGLVDFALISDRKEAVWGFYLGDEDAPTGSGQALGEQGLEFAFRGLNVEKVIGETFAFNERGIRFHERLGFKSLGILKGFKIKNGRAEDVVKFELSRQDWVRRSDNKGSNERSK